MRNRQMIALIVLVSCALFFPAADSRAEADYQVIQKEEKELEGYNISLKSAELSFSEPMYVRLRYEEIDAQGKTVVRSFRALDHKSSRVIFRVAIIPDDSFDGFVLKYTLHSADPADSARGAQIVKTIGGKYSYLFGHLEEADRFGYSHITKAWERGWEPGYIRLNNVFVETSKTPFPDEW